MSEHDPIRDFHDELLSAYLDDELTPAERTRVEERLAVDPVARQMLEELRGVSQAMQRLPHQKLSEDLSPAILARAKQAVPTNGKAQETTPASTALAGGSVMPAITIGRSRRGWVWAAMAVAAALLLMFYDRSQQQGQNLPNVADARRAPAETDTTRLARGVPEMRSLEEQSAERFDGADYLRLLKSKADADDKVAASGTNGSASGELNGRGTLTRAGESQPNDLAGGRAVSSTSDVKLQMDRERSDGLDLRARGERLAAGELLGEGQQMDRAGGRTMDRYAVSDEAAKAEAAKAEAAKAEADKKLAEAMTRESSRESEILGAGRGLADSMGGLATTGGSPATVPTPTATAPAAPALSTATVLNAPTSNASAVTGTTSNAAREGVLVVYVNVRPEALRDRVIDGKLASNGIVIDATAATPVDSFANEERAEEASLERLKLNFYAYFGDNVKEADLSQTDAILVDAPAARVAGLLAALDADSDNVVGISIDDKQVEGNQAKAEQLAQLAIVDWSKFNRVTLPDELRRMYQLEPQGRGRQVANNGSVPRGADASGSGGETARGAVRGRGGARGGRGAGGAVAGGAGGGAAMGGGGGRGGRSNNAVVTNEPTGGSQPAAGGPPANVSTPASGEESEAKRRTEASSMSQSSGGLGDANKQAQEAGKLIAIEDGVSNPSQQSQGGQQSNFGFGGGSGNGQAESSQAGARGGGGGGGIGTAGQRRGGARGGRGGQAAQQNSGGSTVISAGVPAGRAKRLLLSPQPQAQPMDGVNQFYTKQQDTSALAFQDAQRQGNGQTAADKPAATQPGANVGQSVAGEAKTDEALGNRISSANAGDSYGLRTLESKSAPQPARDAASGEKIDVNADAAAAARAPSANERDAVSRQNAAAQVPQRSDSLQVLFVLRAAPAAPAAEPATTPASSRPAADQAK